MRDSSQNISLQNQQNPQFSLDNSRNNINNSLNMNNNLSMNKNIDLTNQDIDSRMIKNNNNNKP